MRSEHIVAPRFVDGFRHLTLSDWFVLALISPGCGLLSVTLPVAVAGSNTAHPGFLRNAVENMHPLSTMALLFATGAVLSLFSKRLGWRASLPVMAVFVVWVAWGVLIGDDHNLFPLELGFYGVLTGVAFGGAWTATRWRSRRNGWRATPAR